MYCIRHSTRLLNSRWLPLSIVHCHHPTQHQVAVRVYKTATASTFNSSLPICRSFTNLSPHRNSPSSSSSSSSSLHWVCLFSLFVGGVYLSISEVSADPQSINSKSWLSKSVNAAAAKGDLSTVQRLLSQYHPAEGVNLTHPNGWTPLLTAAANGHVDVVEWLIEQGANLNTTDKYVITRKNLSTELLRNRAEFHPQINPRISCIGWTPLHYAVAFQHVPVIEALLAAGADTTIKNAEGDDPLSVIDWDQLESGKETKQQITELFTQQLQKRELQQKQREKEERIKHPLEMKLRETMVGQLMPILSVSSAIRRRDNGWYDSNKPLVFLFLGSSGVGKTMLAKSLAAEIIKDKENGFIRIDMTEFASKHEMARLIGSPPGYVGYEEGGQLTTKLEKCPEAVVLLDEVEKAHPDVLTLMLQVFDEGRLTDGKGHTISCPNAIFIMTSNLVQEEIRDAIRLGNYILRPDIIKQTKTRQQQQQQPQELQQQQRTEITEAPINKEDDIEDGQSALSVDANFAADDKQISLSKSVDSSVFKLPNTVETIVPSPATPDVDPATVSLVAKSTDDFLRHQIHPILKRHFRREEFLGRINDMVIFHPLSDEDLTETVNTELMRWKKRAYERHQIELNWNQKVIDVLKSGYDERYGYRSIIYTVEKKVVNLLAAAHERDVITRGSLVAIDVEEEEGMIKGGKINQRIVIRKVGNIDSTTSPTNNKPEEKSRWFTFFSN